MDVTQYIKQHFSDSIETKKDTAEMLLPAIAKAGKLMATCLADKHKILSCGNGGSACDAQHFAAELLNRFEIERESLAGISLVGESPAITAIGNDYDFNDIFAKQIRALGQPGDVLLAITTSGGSKNILAAIEAAHNKQMPVIALTGKDGGKVAPILNEHDIEIRIPAKRTPRIQETHILVIHCLCDLIDQHLFGKGEFTS